MMAKRQLYAIAFLLLQPLALFAQTSLRVMEWNVENLFDTRHDTLKNDYDFMPDSERHWTHARYWRKLNDIARGIMAVGETRLPDLVALCEVENDSVLHSLTRLSALRTLGYDYIVTSSPDPRGIDCALLYQPFAFLPIEWRSVGIPSAEHGFHPTRDLLYVKGVAGIGDTVHIIVCHLPSSLGGRVSARHRRLAMSVITTLTDSLQGSAVIVLGDFNTPRPAVPPLIPVSSHLSRRDSICGTYRYRGDWQQIDHIFITPTLRADTLHIARFPFLLEPNLTYGGLQPRRTYRGPAYYGGVSDHLPIYTDILLR